MDLKLQFLKQQICEFWQNFSSLIVANTPSEQYMYTLYW